MTAWSQERERYADKMRKMGTPLMVTPEEFAAAALLLEKARAAGMSDRMIVDQTGVPGSLPAKVRRGTISTMHRDTLEKLCRLRPERPPVFFTPTRGKVGGGTYVDSTGTVRRVQALRADGFPGRTLGDLLSVSYEAVAQLARSGRPVVQHSTRLAVKELYTGLDGRWPCEFGVVEYAVGKCATYARRAGYVPRSCWDPDTIDDPAAIPDWTGRCGTRFGVAVHKREGIPVCEPCQEAYTGELYPGFSGELLRQLRVRRGMSRPALARDLNLNPATIQYWENGRNKPTRQGKLDEALSALDGTYEDVCEAP